QRYINVSGENLEDALRQASIELGLAVKKIDYEVLDPGSKGVMGTGKKPTLILAYPSAATMKALAEESFGDMSFDDTASATRDGYFSIRRDDTGLLLRVSPPQNGGAKVSERQVFDAILERFHGSFDRALVSKVCKRADEEFIKIADIDRNRHEDAALSIELAEMEMRANIIIRAPGNNGADPAAEDIVAFL